MSDKEIRERIERCEREIAICIAGQKDDPVFAFIGEMDWTFTKLDLEKELRRMAKQEAA